MPAFSAVILQTLATCSIILCMLSFPSGKTNPNNKLYKIFPKLRNIS